MSLADELAADLDFSDDEFQEEEQDRDLMQDQERNNQMETDDAAIEDEDEQRERIESMQMGNVNSVNQVSKLLHSKTTQDILKVRISHTYLPCISYILC
jgi:U4/U6 small nuclear ribonucleoprotein PRP31